MGLISTGARTGLAFFEHQKLVDGGCRILASLTLAGDQISNGFAATANRKAAIFRQ
jgi:hypothetical protein